MRERNPSFSLLTFTTRTPECERGVHFIFDLYKCVQDHGATTVQTGRVSLSFVKMFYCSVIDLIPTAYVLRSTSYVCIRGLSPGLSGSQRYTWNAFILGSGAAAATVWVDRTIWERLSQQVSIYAITLFQVCEQQWQTQVNTVILTEFLFLLEKFFLPFKHLY